MSYVKEAMEKVLEGRSLGKKEAIELYLQPLEALCTAADKLRRHFCADEFDICTIINGKSGNCSEDCKFCAQSACSNTLTAQYPLLSTDEIVTHAAENQRQGVLRYSIVTSGKRLSDAEVDIMCEAVRQIRSKVEIAVCVSFGLLEEAQYRRLKEAGVTRVHNNLETSGRFFSQVCTTHTYADKIKAIKAAQAAGLAVCSGGIMGLGELPEDRVDMAITLRDLGIKSVPINMLNPIPGTPFAQNPRLTADDMRRIVAIYRFLLPTASIRLAGGRGLLPDKGESCFLSGANAAISGDMLTTSGITVKTDMALLQKLGYKAGLCNE
ncbi:MAG: biotin synthase BioB [Christensenella sp.]|nr:biotin synthase BioB [Christensenella sp.]